MHRHRRPFEMVRKRPLCRSRQSFDPTIFVQAHVPIQQPVRKVRCSGQYFDLGVESPFWKAMEKYGVDVYFAGEVHSNTATKAAASGLVQLVTRSNGLYGFLTLELSEDIIEIMYMRLLDTGAAIV